MPISKMEMRRSWSYLFAAVLGVTFPACAETDEIPPREDDSMLAQLGEDIETKVVPPLKSDVEIASVVASGSGCPTGSYGTDIRDDGGGKRVTVAFQRFGLAGDEPADFTRDCAVSVNIRHERPVALRVSTRTGYRGHGPALDPSREAPSSNEIPDLSGSVSVSGGFPTSKRSSSRGISLDGTYSGALDGQPDGWTTCAREHELRTTTRLAPSGGADVQDSFDVVYEEVRISSQACPLEWDEGVELSARIKHVTASGTTCPSSISYAPNPDWPGTLLLGSFGNGYDPITARAPYVGRCTLDIDLQVPPGYQFRLPQFNWNTTKFGSRAAKVTATYSFGGAAQRTEWSPEAARLPGQFDLSTHALDLWSPSCREPGKPVRLTVDLEIVLDGTPDEPVELRLGGQANFKNWATNGISRLRDPSAAQWIRCDAAAP